MYFNDDPFSGNITERMSVDFTTKGENLTYMGEPLVLMTGIDLSMNQLSGTIPPPLGFLRQLKSLNLSHNQLVGPIPETFILPIQLVNLSFLCSFNVSYNNLSGEIPFQQQLGTFDESTFKENDNLCGKIINKNCSSVLHQNQGGVFDAIDSSLVFQSFVFGCFALGFWGTVSLLIWDEGCRRRLCDLMDALVKKIDAQWRHEFNVENPCGKNYGRQPAMITIEELITNVGNNNGNVTPSRTVYKSIYRGYKERHLIGNVRVSY
uniref:Leucine-rich repeat-containing N-terminal plant-type domain-containing protein n=1 Tax=Oryza punctata TaxID=4537 RepID=A0A0E0KMA8_ORYPU